MLIADYDYDTDIRVKKQEAYEEGKAQQKAEDEKILQETVSQISAQKDAEINRLLGEISELKAKLKS